jgi:hypothetical protein
MLRADEGDSPSRCATTAVVMSVAEISPQDAWQQPLLRLIDTMVGVAVGVSCMWAGPFLLSAFSRATSN